MSTRRGRTALAEVRQGEHDNASALLGAPLMARNPAHRDGETPLRDLLGDQVLDPLPAKMDRCSKQA